MINFISAKGVTIITNLKITPTQGPEGKRYLIKFKMGTPIAAPFEIRFRDGEETYIYKSHEKANSIFASGQAVELEI